MNNNDTNKSKEETIVTEIGSDEIYATFYECVNCGCDLIMSSFIFCPKCGREIDW